MVSARAAIPADSTALASAPWASPGAPRFRVATPTAAAAPLAPPPVVGVHMEHSQRDTGRQMAEGKEAVILRFQLLKLIYFVECGSLLKSDFFKLLNRVSLL